VTQIEPLGFKLLSHPGHSIYQPNLPLIIANVEIARTETQGLNSPTLIGLDGRTIGGVLGRHPRLESVRLDFRFSEIDAEIVESSMLKPDRFTVRTRGKSPRQKDEALPNFRRP
jgi:hypothetical protein